MAGNSPVYKYRVKAFICCKRFTGQCRNFDQMELKHFHLAFFVVFLVSEEASAPVVDQSLQLCGVDWIYNSISQFCYLVVLDQMKAWSGAGQYCQEAGGDLLSISDASETSIVAGVLSNIPNATDQNSYWIGATDLAQEGVWRWTDGTPFSYTNWYTDEPNNGLDQFISENCAEMVLPWSYRWNDFPCSNTIAFICKKDVDECASNPCQNGAQCIDGQDMFTCVCSSGWTGTTCQTGFVCNPDNTIDVSNLPANFNYFAMQNVTSGPDIECTVTPTSSTSVHISGCSKDLDILLTYSTYNGMSPNALHGGRSLTAVLVKCREIPDNGTVHNINNTLEADLLISSDTDVAPTYSVESSLSTNSTTAGSDVTWTITSPEEYILEVTSCTAYPGTDSSSSESVSLISNGGCTITDKLISSFTDHGNGSVTAIILAFKFYNNDYVFLQCDLKVCPNDSSACDTQCSRTKRSLYKRSVQERTDRDAPDDYYTGIVNTVLRVVEPEISSGSTQLSHLSRSKIVAFAILLVLLFTGE